MAFDAFLMFAKPTAAQPVVGEAQDGMYKGAVEITEFSFGVEHEKLTIGSASGGGGAGRATFKEFTIKKTVDKASPYLFRTCALGGHYQCVKLFLRKAGAGTGFAEGSASSGKAYLVFVFGTVMIKSINWNGSTGDDAPSEEVVFEYGQIYIKYSQQLADGTLTGTFDNYWDRVSNTDNPSKATGFDKSDSIPSVS